MSNEFTIIYELLLTISIFGMVFSLVWILHNKKQWGYIIAPLFLFINVFLYTGALKFEILSHKGNELWEGIIILHALLLSILMIFSMPPMNSIFFRQKNKNK